MLTAVKTNGNGLCLRLWLCLLLPCSVMKHTRNSLILRWKRALFAIALEKRCSGAKIFYREIHIYRHANTSAKVTSFPANDYPPSVKQKLPTRKIKIERIVIKKWHSTAVDFWTRCWLKFETFWMIQTMFVELLASIFQVLVQRNGA